MNIKVLCYLISTLQDFCNLTPYPIEIKIVGQWTIMVEKTIIINEMNHYTHTVDLSAQK